MSGLNPDRIPTEFCPTLEQSISEANANIEELFQRVDEQHDELTTFNTQIDDVETQIQSIQKNITETNSKIGELEKHDQELRRGFNALNQIAWIRFLWPTALTSAKSART